MKKKRVEVKPEALSLELQAVVDAVDKTPQERAKAIRQIYGALGYPDKKHRGTVRDFMKEHNIPIV